MKKFIGNKISKKTAMEIFGKDELVVQGIGNVLIGDGVEESEYMYSAKPGNKFISKFEFVDIVRLEDAKGKFYVAD